MFYNGCGIRTEPVTSGHTSSKCGTEIVTKIYGQWMNETTKNCRNYFIGSLIFYIIAVICCILKARFKVSGKQLYPIDEYSFRTSQRTHWISIIRRII